MTALLAQRLIALPFLALGGWCLVFPATVARLGLRPEHLDDSLATSVLIGCFGAQAVLSGLFAMFARFTRTTFLVYALALLPFFAFNYWFVFVEPVFTAWMALDFVANLAMLALCAVGYRRSPN